MAHNSDGYIMIDFAEVDFSRTNQTIDGLFDRCQKIIGSNKFVIVINANNKTPLPSAVSFTNNQYVIESVLFNFTISSNDNLYIKKNTPAGELIDDQHMTLSTTYSSSKIEALINGVKYQRITYELEAGASSITEHDERYVDNKTYWVGTSIFGFMPDVVTVTPETHDIYIHFPDVYVSDITVEVIIL